jgi:hypothetical protein
LLPAGPWRLPLLAALLTLAVVVMVYVALFSLFVQRPPAPESSGVETVHQRVDAGKQALAKQDFQAALAAFRAARDLHEQQPSALRASEARQLLQLVRQAEVLTNRLPEPLERMLRRWDKLEGEELENVTAPHRNKFAVFDLEVMRDGTGQFHYSRRVGMELPQLGLGELKLIQRLPLLNHLRRLLFAARLAHVTRDAQDKLTVGLVPDSGVLLTEPEVAKACFPLVDDEMEAVLRWQAGQALELP